MVEEAQDSNFLPEEFDLLYESTMAFKWFTWKKLQAAVHNDKLPENDPIRQQLQKRYECLETLQNKFSQLLLNGKLPTIRYRTG